MLHRCISTPPKPLAQPRLVFDSLLLEPHPSAHAQPFRGQERLPLPGARRGRRAGGGDLRRGWGRVGGVVVSFEVPRGALVFYFSPSLRASRRFY